MDMGTSVLARLKNKAKETGRPFQLHLQLFCQEEFLRRLAASKYAQNLVLKGGLFIYTLTNFESRATVDVDFLLRRMKMPEMNLSEVMTAIDQFLRPVWNAILSENEFTQQWSQKKAFVYV